jgi:hypothetical protein
LITQADLARVLGDADGVEGSDASVSSPAS